MNPAAIITGAITVGTSYAAKRVIKTALKSVVTSETTIQKVVYWVGTTSIGFAVGRFVTKQAQEMIDDVVTEVKKHKEQDI